LYNSDSSIYLGPLNTLNPHSIKIYTTKDSLTLYSISPYSYTPTLSSLYSYTPTLSSLYSYTLTLSSPLITIINHNAWSTYSHVFLNISFWILKVDSWERDKFINWNMDIFGYNSFIDFVIPNPSLYKILQISVGIQWIYS